jgi:hypothetical protein
MDFQSATDRLEKSGLTVIPSTNPNLIRGGSSTVQHKGSSYVTDPFTIVKEGNIWIATFQLGIAVITCNASPNVDIVANSICDVFEMGKKIDGGVNSILRSIAKLQFHQRLVAYVKDSNTIRVFFNRQERFDFDELLQVLLTIEDNNTFEYEATLSVVDGGWSMEVVHHGDEETTEITHPITIELAVETILEIFNRPL